MVELPRLSRLSPVVARDVWVHEAHVFTPWLLENQDHLAQALGIELELTDSEHAVGGFKLDLIGRDLTHQGVLIVENQLEATDHSHLGQLLTYVAGTDAATVVWIATGFREEHREAIDWLNRRTDEEVRFFGVVLEAVRIDDSLPAPLFTVVAKPNDWQKRVHASTSRSAVGGPRTEAYATFWARYLERLRANYPTWTRSRSTPRGDNWFQTISPVRGTYIAAAFAEGRRLKHELYIDSGDATANEELLAELEAQRHRLETVYRAPVEFEPLPDRRACRVAEYREDGDVLATARHDEYLDWFIDAGIRLRRALGAVSPGTSGEAGSSGRRPSEAR
jgi:hypothetical protein